MKEQIVKTNVIKNRRASFDYFFLQTYTAGIVLCGTEIKSIRAGKASLVDTYCYVNNHEIWVKNMYVAEYAFGSYNNHSIRRDRKLLLNKREITKLEQQLKNPGHTIVPIELYINEKGLVKVEISLARGKKMYDKRASLKDKTDRREMERVRNAHNKWNQ